MSSQKTDEQLWVICPVCHEANPAGIQFCQHCWGAAIHSSEALTNEQLAEMVTRRTLTQTDLASIEGIGKARLEKYGTAFLNLLKTQLAKT